MARLSLTSTFRPRVVRTSFDRSAWPVARRLRTRRPLDGAVGGDHADFEQAVVGAGLREGGEPAGEGAHVAEQHAAGPALEP